MLLPQGLGTYIHSTRCAESTTNLTHTSNLHGELVYIHTSVYVMYNIYNYSTYSVCIASDFRRASVWCTTTTSVLLVYFTLLSKLCIICINNKNISTNFKIKQKYLYPLLL